MNIGKFLQRLETSKFKPYFTVTPNQSKLPITQEHIERMTKHGEFDMGKPISFPAIGGVETSIEFYFETDIHIPISGFPRILTAQDPLQCKFFSGHFCYSRMSPYL
jgi:hypothetical protein